MSSGGDGDRPVPATATSREPSGGGPVRRRRPPRASTSVRREAPVRPCDRPDNAEQFSPGGAARSCSEPGWAGVAATVGENCIGLHRCPDAALWGLNGGRCGQSRWTRESASGHGCHRGCDLRCVGVGAGVIEDARPVFPPCDARSRHTTLVTRAGRRGARDVARGGRMVSGGVGDRGARSRQVLDRDHVPVVADRTRS